MSDARDAVEPVAWHASADLLARYAVGRVDDAAAWSVEVHVTGCDVCRTRLDEVDPPGADDATLDHLWRGIEGELRTTRRPVERALVAMGVPGDTARLLAVTPSLTLSWLLAVGVVLAFAVVTAHLTAGAGAGVTGEPVDRAPMLFLLLAPLVPLLGVAAAFGPRVDPTYEIGLTAPIRGPRLLLTRATAVFGASLVLAAAASMFLPQFDWTAAAWVVPALAVTSTALAASTWMPPLPAAAAIGAVWVALVLVAEAASEVALVAFRADGQLLAAAVLVATAAIVAMRRERFDVESRG